MNTHTKRPIAASRLLLAAFSAFFLITAAPDAVAASPRPSIHRHMIRPNTTFSRRFSYTPKVKFEQPKSNFVGTKATPLEISFSTRRGFVSRVEVFVDGKLFRGVAIQELASKGTVRIQPNLTKAGPGTHTIEVKAWQGRPGYQSLHGLSKKRKFTN